MLFLPFGPSVEIRTRGLLNPIQARYQTSPHPDLVDLATRLEYDTTSIRKNQELFSIFSQEFENFTDRFGFFVAASWIAQTNARP